MLSCSVNRAIYLTLVPNLNISKFIRSLKRLMGRRGRPKIAYSDNSKTGVKVVQKVNKDKKWHHCLNQKQMIT